MLLWVHFCFSCWRFPFWLADRTLQGSWLCFRRFWVVFWRGRRWSFWWVCSCWFRRLNGKKNYTKWVSWVVSVRFICLWVWIKVLWLWRWYCLNAFVILGGGRQVLMSLNANVNTWYLFMFDEPFDVLAVCCWVLMQKIHQLVVLILDFPQLVYQFVFSLYPHCWDFAAFIELR